MPSKSVFSLKNAILLSAVVFTFIMAASTAFAQDQPQEVLPELPGPVKTLVDQGAQVRFLGRDLGVEGWVAIKNGQEQYFYVLPNGQGFLSGVLFDKDGKVVTIDQVRRLRQHGDAQTLDTLAADTPAERADAEKKPRYEFMTPSEQLFYDVENSNWIPVGKAGTPLFYAFIDPQCPHCHELMARLKKDIKAGKLQVRMIPVGRTEQSKAQAAFLMASPDPEDTWWRHLDGDETALPAKQGISTQGVERNLMIMQTWKLEATPLIVYRGKDNTVKIIRGTPKDYQALISDLGSRV